jgi:hypothetical protein
VGPKILKNIEDVKVGFRWGGGRAFYVWKWKGCGGRGRADEDIGNANPSRFGALVRI